VSTQPSEDERPDESTVPDELIDTDEYAAVHGERFEETIDLDRWEQGVDLGALYRRLETEVAPAVEQERRVQQVIREHVFDMLRESDDRPPDAGVHTAKARDLEEYHRKVLFSGQLETCDGTSVTHDTLLLTVTQIGICLISYEGNELALTQRLFRRDLRARMGDPVTEAMELLNRRKERAAPGVKDRRDTLSDLGRRGIMTYAERATLLRRSNAAWRMGHGDVAPYELLTGSGYMQLLDAALKVLRELVAYERFVFVPSSIKDRLLLTIGDALHPLEYAIIDTAERRMAQIVDNGRYAPEYSDIAKKFVADCGPKIVYGVFRASAFSPATPFFAHVDHAHEAAHVAMADSALQEHRGFPLSIELADAACSAMFGPDTFLDAVAAAYRESGEPTRYLPERMTRRK
jgi:hypothetical protein